MRHVQKKPKRTKMLKSKEYSNYHELLSQEWIMGDVPEMDKWEIPNFQTIRHIKPSILKVACLVTGLN